MPKDYCLEKKMKLKIDYTKTCADNFSKIEREINRLSDFVMESKRFEKWVFYSVIVFYGYILFNVFAWFGRTFL